MTITVVDERYPGLNDDRSEIPRRKGMNHNLYMSQAMSISDIILDCTECPSRLKTVRADY